MPPNLLYTQVIGGKLKLPKKPFNIIPLSTYEFYFWLTDPKIFSLPNRRKIYLKVGETQIQFANDSQWKNAVPNKYNNYTDTPQIVIINVKGLEQR